MNIKLYSAKTKAVMDAKLYITDYNFVIVMGDNVLDVPYGNIIRFTDGNKAVKESGINTDAPVYYIETEKNDIYFSLVDGDNTEFRNDFKQKLTSVQKSEAKQKQKETAETQRQERQAKRAEKKEKKKTAVMTSGDFLISLILLNIPFVNFICWFVWLRKESTNYNKRNLILAEIVIWLFLLIIGGILLIAFRASNKV